MQTGCDQRHIGFSSSYTKRGALRDDVFDVAGAVCPASPQANRAGHDFDPESRLSARGASLSAQELTNAPAYLIVPTPAQYHE